MTPAAGVAVIAAGMAAGTVNTIVGSGSLITFPTLLAIGYPPVLANVSNTVGLLPGSVSGAIGYRRELQGQRQRVVALGSASLAGALTGAVLLLVLPGSVFRGLLPVLILGACALVALQPRLARRAAAGTARGRAHGGWSLLAGVYFTGVYGGYFGAAYGVITLALLGIFVDDSLQRLNGAKNVLGGLVNGTAALVFAVVADVAWEAAGLLAIGAVVGGQIGASAGRRIPAPALRVLIIAVGIVAAAALVV